MNGSAEISPSQRSSSTPQIASTTATRAAWRSFLNLRDGTLKLLQIVPSGGSVPRNFTLSPDGRWLLWANKTAGTWSSSASIRRADGSQKRGTTSRSPSPFAFSSCHLPDPRLRRNVGRFWPAKTARNRENRPFRSSRLQSISRNRIPQTQSSEDSCHNRSCPRRRRHAPTVLRSRPNLLLAQVLHGSALR